MPTMGDEMNTGVEGAENNDATTTPEATPEAAPQTEGEGEATTE